MGQIMKIFRKAILIVHGFAGGVYDYENLSKYSDYDRHLIWQYKYLDLPIERLSKKYRQMIEKYIMQERCHIFSMAYELHINYLLYKNIF